MKFQHWMVSTHNLTEQSSESLQYQVKLKTQDHQEQLKPVTKRI